MQFDNDKENDNDEKNDNNENTQESDDENNQNKEDEEPDDNDEELSNEESEEEDKENCDEEDKGNDENEENGELNEEQEELEENDEYDDNEDDTENTDIATLTADGGGDDDMNVYEDRKKTSKKKKKSRKIFPFLKKRKQKIEGRPNYLYIALDVRNELRNFLVDISLSANDSNILERALFNATVRHINKIFSDEITEDNLLFKQTYLRFVYQCIGALENKVSKQKILQEIKEDKLDWNSYFFDIARSEEKKEIDKLQNPIGIMDLDIPCPKCGGTKGYKTPAQTRSADEMNAYLFWCSNRGCKWHWKIFDKVYIPKEKS